LLQWQTRAIATTHPAAVPEAGVLNGHAWPIGLISAGAADGSPSMGHLVPYAMMTCLVSNAPAGPAVAYTCADATMHHANIVPAYQPWDGGVWGHREEEVRELVDHAWSSRAVDRANFRPEFWYAAGPAPRGAAGGSHGTFTVAQIDDGAVPPAVLHPADDARWPAWVWGVVVVRVIRVDGPWWRFWADGEYVHREMAVGWRCDQIRDTRIGAAALPLKPAGYFPCRYTSLADLVAAGVTNPFPNLPRGARNNAKWASMLPASDERSPAAEVIIRAVAHGALGDFLYA